MEKPLLIAALALLPAFFVGCESVGTQYAISPRSGEAMTGSDGVMTLQKKHKVSVELLNSIYSSKVEELPTFSVSFENQGEEEITFSPQAVKVYSGDVLVRPYTADELVTMIDEAAKRDAEQYTADQSGSFMNGVATGGGPDSRGGGMDNSGMMAKIEAAKRTNKASNQRFNKVEQTRQMARLIIPVNLPPGKSSYGYVKLHAEDIQKDQPLKLVVTMDGEDYEFLFGIDKV